MNYYIKCYGDKEITECQKKLFELGYKWAAGGKYIFYFSLRCVFIIAGDDKTITWNRVDDTDETNIYTLGNCPLFKNNRLKLE